MRLNFETLIKTIISQRVQCDSILPIFVFIRAKQKMRVQLRRTNERRNFKP